jgi:beta-xylosidase
VARARIVLQRYQARQARRRHRQARRLADRQLDRGQAVPDPEEGAGITYHGGYYYLFVSVDNCCRGISSTYHVQVGRSTSITGPYLDAAGTDMMNGGGMEVQGTDAGMIGPGGEFVFASGGSSYLVYHYYDAFHKGDAWVQVRPLTWVGGWPVTGRALVPVPGEPGPPGS